MDGRPLRNTVLLLFLCALSIGTSAALDVTLVNQNGTIDQGAIAEFILVANNSDGINYTSLTVGFIFPGTDLSYNSTNTTPVMPGMGSINWTINITNGTYVAIEANLTGINANPNATVTLNMSFSNGTTINFTQTNLTIQSPPGMGGQGNYTPMWSAAQPASFLSQSAYDLLSFSGAPYVARGDGCYRDPQYADNYSTPGENCCSAKDNNGGDGCMGAGDQSYDLAAVWVDDAEDYLGWHIAGVFTKSPNNLSVCDNINKSVAYVVEFDIDDNQSTGCNPANESCYPGSDYQLWFFPDSNQTLFGFYNETDANGIAFVPNVTISNESMWVHYNCSATDNKDRGLSIIVNKTAAFGSQQIELNFETNSFNVSEATTNPIDLLTDFGGNFQTHLFTGPEEDQAACFQWDNTNQSTCVSNTQGYNCVWKQLGQGGLCDPDFTSFSDGETCFQLSTSGACNDNANNGIGYCRWESQVTQPNGSVGLCVEEFNPFEFGGGNCDSDCSNCFNEHQCGQSDANGGKQWGGCQWYNTSFQPNGFCDAKGLKYGCSQSPEGCQGSVECANAGWTWNSTVNYCLRSAGAEFCFDGIDNDGDSDIDCDDSQCRSTKHCAGNINLVAGDFKGFSPEEAQLMKLTTGMGGVQFLGEDVLGDGGSDNTDIRGFAIGISDFGIGMGIIASNLTDLQACGGAIEDRTFIYTLNTDANSSTGCNITVDGTDKVGAEYLVNYGNYSQVNTSGNRRLVYYCTNESTWLLKDAAIISPPGGDPNDQNALPIECEAYDSQDPESIGPTAVVMVEKGDVGNPTGDVVFYGAIINGTANNLSNLSAYDEIDDLYYTPGTIDFEPVDCFEEPTKCGSEFMILGGGEFMPLEDCLAPGDEDADGDANCADLDCSFTPVCAGSYDPSTDKTRPKVKLSTVDEFDDAAMIRWVTSEPTNGSIKFYYNDSSCGVLNTTIQHLGNPNDNNDDFQGWHDVLLGEDEIGFALAPNTSYYYRTVDIDGANNSALSKCQNFTTLAVPQNVTLGFNFTTGANESDFLGNLSMVINGSPVVPGDSFEGQDVIDVNITLTNPTADPTVQWSITLEGASLSNPDVLDFDGDLIANNTGNGSLIGMDHDAWLNLAQKTGVESIVVLIPEPGARLLHCLDNGSNCSDVSGEQGVELIMANDTHTEWRTPVTIGFSTYSTGNSTYLLNFTNTTTANITANRSETVNVLVQVNNTMNTTEVYNFTPVNDTGLTVLLNGSSSLNAISLASNTTTIINMSIATSDRGNYSPGIRATLSNNTAVTLNSYDDFTITVEFIDNMSPVLSNINASSVGVTTATITWNTDELSNSSVDYGSTVNNGSNVTSHSLMITGLASATLYYYNVTSCDIYGQCTTSGPNNFTTAASSSVTVCSAGCDYTSIHNAVNGVANGGTVQIYSGTYVESINLTDKTVHVYGNNTGTILSSANNETIFNFSETNHSTIRNLSIQGIIGSARYGIWLENTSNITIQNIRSNTTQRGVGGTNVSNINVYDHSGNDSVLGVDFSQEIQSIQIVNSTFYQESASGYGVYIENASDVTIRNVAFGDPLNVPNCCDASGIYFWYVNNSLIYNVSLDTTSNAIYYDGARNFTAELITLINSSGDAISAQESTSGIIRHVSQIEDNFGVTFAAYDSNSIIVENVSATDNTVWPFYLYDSFNLTIRNSSWLDVDEGMLLDNVSNSVFSDIYYSTPSNMDDGIEIVDSNNSIFANMTIHGCATSSTAYYCLDIQNSFNNTIYNNIFNGTQPIRQQGTYNNNFNTTASNATNIIGYNATGGNYWINSTGGGFSNTCNDTVSQDGYCDAPYVLGTNATDYLALTVPGNDITDPVITLVSPTIQENISTLQFVINVTIDEATTVTYNFNGEGALPLCSSCTQGDALVNITSYGQYNVTIIATDTASNSDTLTFVFNLTLDTDGDGIADVDDADDDNDGINDTDDLFTGNATNIGGNFDSIAIVVNGSTNLSQVWSAPVTINITNGSQQLVEFTYNFSANQTLSLANISIQKTTNSSTGSVIISGLDLTPGQTKTVYMDDVSTDDAICIKDAEIASIDEISSGCTGTAEFYVDCPGTNGSYSCTDLGSTYKVSGLNNSGVKETTERAAEAESESSGSSGGGGGGGFYSGAASAEVDDGTVTKNLGWIVAGTPRTLTATDAELSLKEILFTPGTSSFGRSITMTAVATAPHAPSGTTYQIVHIEHDEDVDGPATLVFEVPDTWFETNSFTIEQISVLRLTGSTWTALASTHERTTNGYTITAQTPGLSYFSVVSSGSPPTTSVAETDIAQEEEVTAPSESSQDPPQDVVLEQHEEESSGLPLGKILWSVFTVALLIAVVLVIIHYRKKKDYEVY